jgi:hypothetical protein
MRIIWEVPEIYMQVGTPKTGFLQAESMPSCPKLTRRIPSPWSDQSDSTWLGLGWQLVPANPPGHPPQTQVLAYMSVLERV